MFEDYFMQMLTAIAPQMVHPLSPILAHSFQHFGRYLNASIEADMSFNIA